MDKDLSCFKGEIALLRPQANRGAQMVIDESALFKAFTNLLLKYQNENNGKSPQKIIMYRDGVSDGQLQNAMSLEVRVMKEAFKKLQRGGYSGIVEPKVTYLVCQKRHNIRFRDGSQRDNSNVLPGTVIDSGCLVHPSYFGILNDVFALSTDPL